MRQLQNSSPRKNVFLKPVASSSPRLPFRAGQRRRGADEQISSSQSASKTSFFHRRGASQLPLMITRLLLLLVLFLAGCHEKETTLKVAATPVPQAEILEQIAPDLAKRGIKLEVIVVEDYHLPNRLLAEKRVDANFFQHIPFLDEEKKAFHYNLVVMAKVHIEPMGLYSKRIKSLNELKEGATVAIPSDPTNEARALHLLEQDHLITLKAGATELATPLDIAENPRKLKFREVDAPFLARALPDVDMAAIPANFALAVGLCPEKDALSLESGNSPYANVLVVRKGDEKREDLQILAELLRSDKIRAFLEKKYCGSLLPASK